jgi:hypothetical protein
MIVTLPDSLFVTMAQRPSVLTITSQANLPTGTSPNALLPVWYDIHLPSGEKFGSNPPAGLPASPRRRAPTCGKSRRRLRLPETLYVWHPLRLPSTSNRFHSVMCVVVSVLLAIRSLVRFPYERDETCHVTSPADFHRHRCWWSAAARRCRWAASRRSRYPTRYLGETT